MRKSIRNNVHPALVLIGRNITKEQFKNAYSLWRAGERAAFVGCDLWYVCNYIQNDIETPDPLLCKSVMLATLIERSEIQQFKAAA